MPRSEALRRAGVPLARSNGNETGELRLADLHVAAGRPGRAPRKLNMSIALIDPKPLTRRSSAAMLAKALPDYGIVTASSCEELIELRSRLTGSPNLIIVYIRCARVTDSCVQAALELVRIRLPDARVIVLSDRDDVQIGGEGKRRELPVELNVTPDELSVLDLLREGNSNKLIAAGLNMEESTVKVHVRNILKKLCAANRTEAACVANRILGEHAP
jgi:DNA-binding NarL/FixJ family response regulator